MEGEPTLQTIQGVPRPGDVVAGKYTVERVLGVGGMGIVVAALHLSLGQRFAIKFLAPSAAQGEAVARFEREARAAAGLQSEHVVRIVDVGTLETGTPYMVMEHLVGEDLGQRLRTRGPLPVDESVDYVLQACEAIAEAHARGIVHRDLKPANLFLTKRADGSALVKVLDFGIAKALRGLDPINDKDLTTTAALIGSPFYMSPEQIRTPKAVDARTDVWALGVILFELLTASTPFTGENFGSLCAAIVADRAPPLRARRSDAPIALEAVVRSCLEKDVDRRMPNVAELARAIAPFGTKQAMISVERILNVLGAEAAPAIAPLPASDAPPEATTGPTVSSMAETLPATSDKDVVTGASWSQSRSGTRRPRTLIVAIAVALIGAALVSAALLVGRGDSQRATPAATRSEEPAAMGFAIDAPAAIDSAPRPPVSFSATIASAIEAPSPPPTRATSPLPAPKVRVHAPAAASALAPTPSSAAPRGFPSGSPLDDRR